MARTMCTSKNITFNQVEAEKMLYLSVLCLFKKKYKEVIQKLCFGLGIELIFQMIVWWLNTNKKLILKENLFSFRFGFVS